MINVNVEVNNNPWLKKINNPQKYLNRKLGKIYKNIKFFQGKNIIFTILLTNSSKMKKLNKKFRKINKSTDVLSFPNLPFKKIKFVKGNSFYIGDIAISYEIINLRSKKCLFQSEFDKAWVHGLLHLAGFDHVKNKDYFVMDKIEKRILNLI
tara:strand:- start:1248 stop:1703 length:456 start_codon:yes stop_codon:yes gene_type:complete